MTAAIQLKNLSFAYPNKRVLDHLNLQIQSGEIFGLVGPNGAGKTTLLNLIQSILSSNNHAISVLDSQPGSTIVKEKVATMFQDDLQINNVKVNEFIKLFAAQATHPKNPETVIKELGLSDIQNQLMNKLSGGQRRKVSFASAIVSNPQLLFLDEPTVGMDAETRQNFWRYIEKLRQQNVTIVITSHYLEEIQKVADRIAILQDGQFRYVGTWQTLQSHHDNGQFNFNTQLERSLFTHLPAVESATQTDANMTLISNDTDLTLKALLPFIDQLHDITITRESLESIFLEMTNKGDH